MTIYDLLTLCACFVWLHLGGYFAVGGSRYHVLVSGGVEMPQREHAVCSRQMVVCKIETVTELQEGDFSRK